MNIARLLCLFSVLDWIKSFEIENSIEKVLKEVEPNRVTLHSDHCNVNASSNYIRTFKYLTNQVPTTTLNVNNFPKFVNWKAKTLYQNQNVSAPLHFFILNENNLKEFEKKLNNTFQYIRDSLFYLTTTKIILLINKKEISDKMRKSIIRLAFEYNFYDFAFMNCNSDFPLINNYNPFFKMRLTKAFSNNSIFFPNLLKGLDGYNMRAGVYKEEWPDYYKNSAINYADDIDNYLSMHLLKSYECFTYVLNVTTTFIPGTKINYIRNHVSYKKLDIFIGKITYYPSGNLVCAYNVKPLKTVLLVPVVHEKNYEFNYEILSSVLILSGIIIIFLISAYFLKLNTNEWSLFNIYSLLMGIGTNINPRRCLRSSIIFFTLFTVSFFFVSDIVSDLTTLKYTSNEIPIIQSFQDVLEKNITVIFPYYPIELKYLKLASSGSILKIFNAAKLKYANENYSYDKVSIIFEDDAEKILLRNNGILDGVKLKISNLILFQMNYVVSFQCNSLIKNKFADIYTRILEAGLDIKWRSEYDHANKIMKRKDVQEIDEQNDSLPLILITLTVTLLVISSIVLLLEYFWFYYPTIKLNVIKNFNFLRRKIKLRKRKSTKKMNTIKINVKPQKMQVYSLN